MVGLVIVPIILIANLFSGIYNNLSICYKLTDKTTFGMYIFKNGDFDGVPSECVTSWKNSDGHNKNMLIYNVTKIGVGTYISNTNGFRLNVVMVVR